MVLGGQTGIPFKTREIEEKPTKAVKLSIKFSLNNSVFSTEQTFCSNRRIVWFPKQSQISMDYKLEVIRGLLR